MKGITTGLVALPSSFSINQVYIHKKGKKERRKKEEWFVQYNIKKDPSVAILATEENWQKLCCYSSCEELVKRTPQLMNKM